ncbi:hypothetical protein QL285_002878 [Trifolium repens]|nr:hypothetical protein QL285_002878 [Trifolium repens]
MILFIACVEPPVLSNGKEMNRYVVRSLIDTNDWLATTFVEILVQFWDTMIGSLEVMKTGFAFRMMSLYAFMPWDPGDTNILMLMLINTHECGWKSFSSSLNWLNFVYDRGKLWEILLANLQAVVNFWINGTRLEIQEN